MVLVTGGSRGIGAATAVAYAAEGTKAAIMYHGDESAAGAVVEQIVATGPLPPLDRLAAGPSAGAQVFRLPASGAFHIAVMVSAEDEFAAAAIRGAGGRGAAPSGLLTELTKREFPGVPVVSLRMPYIGPSRYTDLIHGSLRSELSAYL